MNRVLALVLALPLYACGSAQPAHINTPEDYQKSVGELVTQVIDIFKTDGTNCDMIQNELHGVAGGSKFKNAHDWAATNDADHKLAKAKIHEQRADFDAASAPAMHACGGEIGNILFELME